MTRSAAGHGNDSFLFDFKAEWGGTITDFSSAKGKNVHRRMDAGNSGGARAHVAGRSAIERHDDGGGHSAVLQARGGPIAGRVVRMKTVLRSSLHKILR